MTDDFRAGPWKRGRLQWRVGLPGTVQDPSLLEWAQPEQRLQWRAGAGATGRGSDFVPGGSGGWGQSVGREEASWASVLMHREVSGSGEDREPGPPRPGADAQAVRGPRRLLGPEDSTCGTRGGGLDKLTHLFSV